MAFFTGRSTDSVQTAGPKIALCFLHLFVSLFVHPLLSRVQYVTSYVAMQLQYYIAAFGGLQAKLQQKKVVVCCPDGENLVGSHKDPAFVAYRY